MTSQLRSPEDEQHSQEGANLVAIKQIDHMRRQTLRVMNVASITNWTIESSKIDPVPDSLASNGPFTVRVDLSRRDEKIHIEWTDGRLLVAPLYTFAGVETKLRNTSAVLQQCGRQPDPKAAIRRQRAIRAAGGKTNDLVEISRALPWDPDEMSDKELLKACYGRKLVWENKTGGWVEEDMVKEGVNFNAMIYKIQYSSVGRRIIMFHGHSAFRAAAVETLLRVI